MSAVDKAGAAKEKGDQMVAKLSEGDSGGGGGIFLSSNLCLFDRKALCLGFKYKRLL